MTRTSFTAVSLSFCLAASALGARVLAQTAVTSVSGRVVDTAQQPVRRAIVTLTGAALAAGRSAVSDDDGRFTIAGVPPGDFTVSAARPAFLRANYGASRPGRAGTPVSVRANTPVADLTIVMTHGAAISGTLRDVAGDVAEGMRVQAIHIRHSADGDHAEEAGEAWTDDRGEFRLYGLPAGDYVLAATPAIIVGGMGEIGARSESEVDAVLAALRTRSGASAPGAGAPGQSGGQPPLAPAPRGFATPATYFPGVVQASQAQVIALGAAEDRNGADFAMQLSHAAQITGAVTPVRGQDVPQLQIEIVGDGPALPVAGGSMSAGPSVTQRPSDHTFVITNVPPGHYQIRAHTLGISGAPTTIISSGGALPTKPTGAPQWAQVDVDMSGEDISGVSLVLQPAPPVAGKLSADGAAKPPADLSSSRLFLDPLPASDRRSNGLGTPLAATVRADGAVEWPAVLPGVYRLRAALPSGWVIGAATAGGADVYESEVTVGPTGIADLAVTMTDRVSSIGGTLTGEGNLPATAYHLVAFSTDRARWRAPSRRVKSTRPATSGRFEIQDLPPGEYFLAALSDLETSDLEDPTFLDALVPAAVKVVVTAGQRTVQDLKIGG